MWVEILWSYCINLLCCHLCLFIILVHLMNSSSSFLFLQSLVSCFCLLSHNGLTYHIMNISCHVWVPAVFAVYESFSSGWFCPVECIILLFLSFHGVFIVFYGFHEYILCSVCFNPCDLVLLVWFPFLYSYSFAFILG